MAGLKKIADQNKFRRKAEKVAEKLGLGVDFDWQVKSIADDAYEDDGCLHIERHGLHLAIGFNGENESGEKANERIRAIMEAVGLKRKIGKRVLVEEECEECDGDGEVLGGCGHYHSCDACGGEGFTTPDDYK